MLCGCSLCVFPVSRNVCLTVQLLDHQASHWEEDCHYVSLFCQRLCLSIIHFPLIPYSSSSSLNSDFLWQTQWIGKKISSTRPRWLFIRFLPTSQRAHKFLVKSTVVSYSIIRYTVSYGIFSIFSVSDGVSIDHTPWLGLHFCRELGWVTPLSCTPFPNNPVFFSLIDFLISFTSHHLDKHVPQKLWHFDILFHISNFRMTCLILKRLFLPRREMKAGKRTGDKTNTILITKRKLKKKKKRNRASGKMKEREEQELGENEKWEKKRMWSCEVWKRDEEPR